MEQQQSNEPRIWSGLSSNEQTHIILFWLVVISVVLGFISAFRDGNLDWRSLSGNLSTELFGGVITFVIIDRVIGSQREREEKQEVVEGRKKALIEKLGSRINTEAIRAAEELHAQGWLEDGSARNAMLDKADLHEANFDYADLQGASLKNANLEGSRFRNANLQSTRLFAARLFSAILYKAKLQNANLMNADLRDVNLQEAELDGAGLKRIRLQGADLWRASLKRTYLLEANLENANLSRAALEGANLTDANLQNVNVKGVTLDSDTILPDGSKWTSGTNLSRFTNPKHPNFWRSENPASPAYLKEKTDE